MGTLKGLAPLALLWIATPASAEPLAPWRTFIVEASARFAIPEAWIERVMRAESGGRTTVAGAPIRSRVGAIGLMQLMPRTWRAMRDAYRLRADPDDPHDNILAEAAYLRLMYDAFGYPGLFAGYNAGPARYADFLYRGAQLPAETRAYVAAVGSDQRPAFSGLARRSAGLFAIARPTDGLAEPGEIRAQVSMVPTQAVGTEQVLRRSPDRLFAFQR